MHAFLGVVILLGMWNTFVSGWLHIGGEYNDRRGVSLWFRGIWTFQPDPASWRARPLETRAAPAPRPAAGSDQP